MSSRGVFAAAPYDPGPFYGHHLNLFTAFGLPQPVWVMSACVVIFTFPALILYRRLAAGATVAVVMWTAIAFAVTTTVFEIIVINTDFYGYHGPTPRPSTAVMTVCAFVSMRLALTSPWWTVKLLVSAPSPTPEAAWP